MKKIILSSALAVFGLVGIANATVFTEEYTGCQYVGEGQSYTFEFDLWVDNYISSNSNLSLTTDASGAFGAGEWESAYIYVDLFSKDSASETAAFSLTAYNRLGDEEFFLGEEKFNKKKKNKKQIKTFGFFLTDSQLDAFESEGWGNIEIMASLTGKCNYNDFAIKTVGIEVTTAPVPEPSTMLLFGAGALGLLGYNRKRSNKKA